MIPETPLPKNFYLFQTSTPYFSISNSSWPVIASPL
jgi:hypothetical protein